MLDCEGRYTISYVCDNLCDATVRERCIEASKKDKTMEVDKVMEDKQQDVLENKEVNTENTEDTTSTVDDVKEEKNEQVLDVSNEKLSVNSQNVITIFEDRKYPKTDIMTSFFKYFQRFWFSHEVKETYIKIFKEPDHKICFYLFFSRKPSIEIKSTRDKLEKISKYIIKEASNITIQFENEEDAVYIASIISDVFSFKLDTEVKTENTTEKSTNTTDNSKKEELKIDSADSKALIVKIAKEISNGIKEGVIHPDSLTNPEETRKFLETKKLVITDDIDLPKLLIFLKDRYYSK